MLRLASGAEFSGPQLKALVEEARSFRGILQGLHTRYDRAVVEQAVLAGAFDAQAAENPGEAEVLADMTAKRLDAIADEIEQGWQGRVTASHCTAMGSYDDAYAFKLIRLLANARMNVISNPFDNVVLQGRFDTYPKRRGLTRVKELLAGNVTVALGHDSIMDPWFPLGRGDMLAAAQLALFLCHMSGYEEISTVFDLITTNAARVLRIEDRYGIEEGKPADFLVLDASSPFEALRLVPARLHVFKAGREVASTQPARSVVQRENSTEEVTYRPA